jgi:hypothetical protein
MQLSTESMERLRHWVGMDTWHTNHLFDMNRWYDFVSQYQRDHGYQVDETALRELIAREAGIGDNEALLEEIRERISLMYRILDFLKQTER